MLAPDMVEHGVEDDAHSQSPRLGAKPRQSVAVAEPPVHLAPVHGVVAVGHRLEQRTEVEGVEAEPGDAAEVGGERVEPGHGGRGEVVRRGAPQ